MVEINILALLALCAGSFTLGILWGAKTSEELNGRGQKGV